jgi:hypothetical protein
MPLHPSRRTGTWRQDDFQNSVRTVDNCASMGFSFPLNPSWTLGLHYVSLGSVALDAIAVTCPQDDCDNTRDFTPRTSTARAASRPSTRITAATAG